METDTVPLSGQAVIGEVGEHLVSTVASENNGSFQCAFCYELSMYLDARFAVKIEPGSGANG